MLSSFYYKGSQQEGIVPKKNIYSPALEGSNQKKEYGFDLEKKLASYVLPLPIDHRLDKSDLDLVIVEIKAALNDADN